jgi:REP element-mobilizing transposase RayT
VESVWNDLPNHYDNIKMDSFVIMPDHIHGIIHITLGNLALPPRERHGLSEFVRGFKTFSSRKINEIRPEHDKFAWQSKFYDHIIRNDQQYAYILHYIRKNPERWLAKECRD